MTVTLEQLSKFKKCVLNNKEYWVKEGKRYIATMNPLGLIELTEALLPKQNCVALPIYVNKNS